MEYQTIECLLEACKPLADKLGREEYDYQFDPTDLTVLATLDQLLEQVTAYSDLETLTGLIESDLIREHEFLWLHAFSDMRVTLQEHAKQAISEEYFPFRQRLEALEQDMHYFLACGVLRLSDDHELFLLLEVAQENPLYLSLAEQMLAEINAEVGGDSAPDRTRQDWILLYELRLQILKYGYRYVCPSDYRKPSTVTREEWLFAHKRGQALIEETKKTSVVGKLILFASSDEIDMLWKKIARATSEGQLGIAAKVSTAKPKKTHHRHDFVLYIYIQDYQNQHDLLRVQSQLAELGVTKEVVDRQEHASPQKATQHDLT